MNPEGPRSYFESGGWGGGGVLTSDSCAVCVRGLKTLSQQLFIIVTKVCVCVGGGGGGGTQPFPLRVPCHSFSCSQIKFCWIDQNLGKLVAFKGFKHMVVL